MLRRLGYVTGQKPITKSQEVALAWLISLRTAMRAQEVLSLKPSDARVVTLTKHKLAAKIGARLVPISEKALRLIKVLPDDGFNVSSRSRDAIFRKARSQCLLDDFTFHDGRALALTLLARRVDILTLARISGHADLRMLQRYYRISAEDIAKML